MEEPRRKICRDFGTVEVHKKSVRVNDVQLFLGEDPERLGYFLQDFCDILDARAEIKGNFEMLMASITNEGEE